MSKYQPCPCKSQKLYNNCCAPFHNGQLPETALELMRSRFSAFALNIPDYIIDTTHEDNPQKEDDLVQWKNDLTSFSEQANFDGLKIVEFVDGETIATVTFTAYLSQSTQDFSFTEKSTFKKEDGRWLYLNGEMEKPLHSVENP